MDRKLIDYFPDVLKDVRELKLICDSEQPEFDQVQGELISLLNNQFFETANVDGIKRWEKMLNLTPRATDTLEQRKFRVQTIFTTQLPYTFSKLEEMMDDLCGVNKFFLDLYPDQYRLDVSIKVSIQDKINDVFALAQKISPANLLVNLIVLYATHASLTPFTHAELGTKTHEEIRQGGIE